MKWISKEAKFKYNGKPVIRKTVVSNTPLGPFKVYESVGGSAFMIHPFMKRPGGLTGYNSDPHNEFDNPKIPVADLEEGVRICEAKWEQVKNDINSI